MPTFRVGVVSFLNARPLIEGLRDSPDCRIVYEVPSRLGKLLADGRVDVASVPVIDYLQRRGRWDIVSDACIASDGSTLTVRVFSHVRPEDLSVLHVDGDSHTSVVLARLVWEGYFGRRIETRPLSTEERPGDRQAVLLIGDKVIQARARRFAYDVDLGKAWKDWTGLPMVFAVWAGQRGRSLGPLARRLREARDRGVARAAQIALHAAADHGWPPELAVTYLTQTLEYRLTDRHRAAIDRFHSLAVEFGVVTTPDSRSSDDAKRFVACQP